jgi:hypothetical protein
MPVWNGVARLGQAGTRRLGMAAGQAPKIMSPALFAPTAAAAGKEWLGL